MCSHVSYLMYTDFPKELTNYMLKVTVWIAWKLKCVGNLEEFCSIVSRAGR